MDAGLWTACKESREAMAKHMDADGRDETQPRAKLMTKGADGNLNGHCVVYPSKDIFCLQATDWNIARGNSELWQVGIQNTTLAGQTSLSMVENIALEFDPSWDIDLPGDYYALMDESSSRGFLSRLIYNGFLHSSMKPTIWLIDRDTLLSRLPGTFFSFPPVSCIDDRENYVQADPHVLCSIHCFDERSRALKEFLYKLDEMGEVCASDHSNCGLGYYGEIVMGMLAFQITDDVKCLVRPDNQVELCTEDHRPVFDYGSDLDEDMGF
jgi:hypothetical protein